MDMPQGPQGEIHFRQDSNFQDILENLENVKCDFVIYEKTTSV